MVRDRLGGQVQFVRDHAVREPGRYEVEHFALPYRELGKRGQSLGRTGSAEHPRSDLAAENRVTGRDRANRSLDLVLLRALEHVAPGSRGERVRDQVLLVEHREHQDADRRVAREDSPRRFYAVHSGHPQIHHDDIRPQQESLAHGVGSCAGLAHDLDARESAEECDHAAAHDRMVVGDQNPRCRTVIHGASMARNLPSWTGFASRLTGRNFPSTHPATGRESLEVRCRWDESRGTHCRGVHLSKGHIVSVTTPRTTISTLGRIGLVIAGLLALGDIVTGATQLGADATLPIEVAITVIVAGVATLVLLPFAWRARRWASIAVVVIRVLSALTAVPAFFVPGLEPTLVIVAAAGIVVSVAAAAFILLGSRTVRP